MPRSKYKEIVCLCEFLEGHVLVFQAVRKKYQQEYDIAPPITFGGDHVALEIPDDGIQTNSGWEIRPNYKPQVSR